MPKSSSPENNNILLLFVVDPDDLFPYQSDVRWVDKAERPSSTLLTRAWL